MDERTAAIRLLTVAAIANAAWVAMAVVDALDSGGFDPSGILPALIPAIVAAVLAWGLRGDAGWARIGAQIAAVVLAVLGIGTMVWFVVTQAAMGGAVEGALFLVIATAIASAVGATILWRGARAPGRSAPAGAARPGEPAA